jgi:Type I restriction enzyme R protein N terminus (HSDR_N)
MIVPLNFPMTPLKLTKVQDVIYVWCIVRKKNLKLTPEEWVRQHAIHWLINSKDVPLGSISAEVALTINGLKRRCDILVVNPYGEPCLVIECKATDILINQDVFFQLAQYNSVLSSTYFMLTNGMNHVMGQQNKVSNQIDLFDNLPMYDKLII